MNRLSTGVYAAAIERKRWLTSDAPGDLSAAPKKISLASEGSLDYETRTAQLAVELARGFSAPEALRARNSRRVVSDLSGKHALDHYTRLPGGLIAARAAVAIAVAKDSAELRRSQTARVAVQRQMALAPKLSQARVAKKPRLSLSPTRSRPTRPEPNEEGEIEERRATAFGKIPKSKPASDVAQPSPTTLSDSPVGDGLFKTPLSPGPRPTKALFTPSQEHEQEWFEEILVALADEELPVGPLGNAVRALRVMPVQKPNLKLATALILPRESIAFERENYRHGRASMKNMQRHIVSAPLRSPLTVQQKMKIPVVNLVDSPDRVAARSASPIVPVAQPLDSAFTHGEPANTVSKSVMSPCLEKDSGQKIIDSIPNLGTEASGARNEESDKGFLPNGANLIVGDKLDTANTEVGTDAKALNTKTDLVNGILTKDSIMPSSQPPRALNTAITVPTMKANTGSGGTPVSVKGTNGSAAGDLANLDMDATELGFSIRKKAPLSHLEKLKRSISATTEEVEEAKGSVKKQEKNPTPRSVGKQTLLARKLLQRRKSVEQKQKSVQRRNGLRNLGSSSVQKGGPLATKELSLEASIARSRPRRNLRASEPIVVDSSDSDSDMEDEDQSTSRSGATYKPPVRKWRQLEPAPATMPARTSPRKHPRTPLREIGKTVEADLPEMNGQKRLRRTPNVSGNSAPLNSAAVRGEETQSSEPVHVDYTPYEEGYKCLKFQEVFVNDVSRLELSSTDDDNEDADLDDTHMDTMPTLRRLVNFDNRRGAQKGLFGLPEEIDEESFMVRRCSNQHDLFTDDEALMLPVGPDSLASKYYESHAGDSKRPHGGMNGPDHPPHEQVDITYEGPTVAASPAAIREVAVAPVAKLASAIALANEGLAPAGGVTPGTPGDDESPEKKAKSLQSRVCGDMMSTMSEEGKQQVMKWAKRDFSSFNEDEDLMEVTLSCTGVTCERCITVQDTMGLCEESIVLKLWRDMTWRKIRRLRHVLGSEEA